MREWLLDGFRYDLWANRLWAPLASGALDEVGLPSGSTAVPTEPRARLDATFAHLLRGQRLWLDQIGAPVRAEGEGWLLALHDGWIGMLETRDVEEPVRYEDWNGRPQTRTLGEIAWHMVNHGTYHRGQMREIAEGAGLGWPETDLTPWLATRSAAK